MIIFAIIANDNEYDHGGRLRMTRMIICLKGGFLHIQSKHVYICYILAARPWKPWWLEEYFPFGIVPFQGVTYVNLQESIYICRLNVVEWTAPPPLERWRCLEGPGWSQGWIFTTSMSPLSFPSSMYLPHKNGPNINSWKEITATFGSISQSGHELHHSFDYQSAWKNEWYVKSKSYKSKSHHNPTRE